MPAVDALDGDVVRPWLRLAADAALTAAVPAAGVAGVAGVAVQDGAMAGAVRLARAR